jgi:pyruvate dehydrogenase E1 component
MTRKSNIYEFENKEWLASLDFIIENEPPGRVAEIIGLLQERARKNGISLPAPGRTPYKNTIDKSQETDFPGDLETERLLENIIRWNAAAMVVKANKRQDGIGGHISTYASAATLFEVAFNHFLHGNDEDRPQDLVYFQGHAAPGIYARSFVERRMDEEELDHFRREVISSKGLPSYPHSRLMPGYWRFPTVSMGLSPLQAIYQARFFRYLENRGIKEKNGQKIWAFIGDGEMDEPESVAGLTLAGRERLDNLILVVNCNLQRLDGPVRGNGKIIQELESMYKAAGWNVIKVLWGKNWDPLLEQDQSGLLVKRLGELVDGQLQHFAAAGGAYFRENFFDQDEQLSQMVEEYSNEELDALTWGGHDMTKIYNAYRAAVQTEDAPTVILAQTIKGFGLGDAGEARNITHQKKKLEEEDLLYLRDRLELPIDDAAAKKAEYYRPEEDSDEYRYLIERREKLGGFLPARKDPNEALEVPGEEPYQALLEGTDEREAATTMSLVQLLSKLMKDENVGERIVPIVPDESRTFGMDALFQQAGIYSSQAQQYEPVDQDHLLSYNESKTGVILEEGITEAGAMGSFIAAGTAHVNLGIDMIPFFLFYSMFGFQRVGDLIWAATDARARGFLIGATSGRTTLSGEGLQHCDGQSHIYALSNPAVKAYDPTYAYEVAVIVQEGIRRMYVEREDLLYYLTVMNEKYPMPPLPGDAREGILRGMYRLKGAPDKKEEGKEKLHLLGSGAILRESVKARKVLEEEYGIAADVWSVTSYKELYDNAIQTDRDRIIGKNGAAQNYIQQCFPEEGHVYIAATDYLKALPLTVSKWFPGTFVALGTDGFGRSDSREALRSFFEVDHKHIVLAALSTMAQQGKITKEKVEEAKKELEIDPEKPYPAEP